MPFLIFFWTRDLEMAFTVPGRPLYNFKVMPFGLCNAPPTMSRLIDKVVPVELRTKVFVYFDILHVTLKSFDRHFDVFGLVTRKIHMSGFTINIKKINVCVPKVIYLSHTLLEFRPYRAQTFHKRITYIVMLVEKE